MWRKTKAAFAASIVTLSLGMTTSSSFAQATSDEGVAGTTTTRYDDDDDDFDLGWIGLAGLAGLAGLMRRDRHDHDDRKDHNLKR